MLDRIYIYIYMCVCVCEDQFLLSTYLIILLYNFCILKFRFLCPYFNFFLGFSELKLKLF